LQARVLSFITLLAFKKCALSLKLIVINYSSKSMCKKIHCWITGCYTFTSRKLSFLKKFIFSLCIT